MRGVRAGTLAKTKHARVFPTGQDCVDSSVAVQDPQFLLDPRVHDVLAVPQMRTFPRRLPVGVLAGVVNDRHPAGDELAADRLAEPVHGHGEERLLVHVAADAHHREGRREVPVGPSGQQQVHAETGLSRARVHLRTHRHTRARAHAHTHAQTHKRTFYNHPSAHAPAVIHA